MNEASTEAALNNEFKKRRKEHDNNYDGGGGEPTIEVSKSRTGIKIVVRNSRPRGISQISTSRHSGKINTVIISNWIHNDKKAARRLSGALRYNQERERGRDEDQRTFYTANNEKLDRADIRAEIRKQFGKDVAFHTMILAPADNNVNLKEFTRETMNEWQTQLGYRINYYAIEHRNTDHYHTHLIIPAKSIDRETDIRFDRNDLTNLREIAIDYLARERMIDHAFDRAVAREFGFDRENRYDQEIQREFHMTNKDYRDQQEAAGLSTYHDFAKDWKDLGIGKECDLGGKNWESDQQMINDLFSDENNVSAQLDTDRKVVKDAVLSDKDEKERDDDDDDGRSR
jgi:hypothetical protein